MFKKLIIASNNPGKLREIGEILAALGIEFMPQSASASPKRTSRMLPLSRTRWPRRGMRLSLPDSLRWRKIRA
jgi:hypothetical protein